MQQSRPQPKVTLAGRKGGGGVSCGQLDEICSHILKRLWFHYNTVEIVSDKDCATESVATVLLIISDLFFSWYSEKKREREKTVLVVMSSMLMQTK